MDSTYLLMNGLLKSSIHINSVDLIKYHNLTMGNVKDKEHFKVRCLVKELGQAQCFFKL